MNLLQQKEFETKGKWLVSKLRDEGQQIEKIEAVTKPYSDSEVYLVTVRKPPTDN